MNQTATKEDIQRLETKLDNTVEDLSEIISNFAQQIDGRFNQIEKEIIDLKESHNRLLNTI